jgi:hypothetical protein
MPIVTISIALGAHSAEKQGSHQTTLTIIASIMLLHRIIWPLTSRVLYALGRYRLVQNKAALHAAGVTLAGIAITGVYGWQTILKHFGIT